jgi:hypothetical protein
VPGRAKAKQGPKQGQEMIMQAFIVALFQRQPASRRKSAR